MIITPAATAAATMMITAIMTGDTAAFLYFSRAGIFGIRRRCALRRFRRWFLHGLRSACRNSFPHSPLFPVLHEIHSIPQDCSQPPIHPFPAPRKIRSLYTSFRTVNNHGINHAGHLLFSQPEASSSSASPGQAAKAFRSSGADQAHRQGASQFSGVLPRR